MHKGRLSHSWMRRTAGRKCINIMRRQLIHVFKQVRRIRVNGLIGAAR